MAEYINKQELLQDIHESVVFSVARSGKGQTSLEIKGANKVLDRIKSAPSADVVEVVHGEWVDATYTYFGAKRYECSRCRDDDFWNKRYIEIKENYCPNCGAKMRGGRNGS